MKEKISPVTNNVDCVNVLHCCKLNHCLTYSTVGTILYDGIAWKVQEPQVNRGARHRASENRGCKPVSLHCHGDTNVVTTNWWSCTRKLPAPEWLSSFSCFLSLPWATQIFPLTHAMCKVDTGYFIASTLLEVEGQIPSSQLLVRLSLCHQCCVKSSKHLSSHDICGFGL